ncbi:MAG: FkbM family methyltransferase [Bacteroidota bacterium]|nr:FkbM family methyltransferase [Bacteroidota bacterium]
MTVKDLIREILIQLRLDLTKNLKYDRLTRIIIQRTVNQKSVCIDVGCHKGEILDLILKEAPKQKHYGFEPIPILYHNLLTKYKDQAHIFNCALSDQQGETTFNYVKNAPAYSGIKQRKYAVEKPDIETLQVKLEKLDDIIPDNEKIDLIKIDVEGGEFNVLKGAVKVIQKSKPYIIFETGLGASEYYGTKPEELYDFFENELQSKIYTLQNWIDCKAALSKVDFLKLYNTNAEYYFIAKG